MSSSVWIITRFLPYIHVTTRHISAPHMEPSSFVKPESYIFAGCMDMVTFSICNASFISLRIALQTNLHVRDGNESLLVCHVPLTETCEGIWKE